MEKVMALALGRDGKVASRKSESIGKKRRHWVMSTVPSRVLTCGHLRK